MKGGMQAACAYNTIWRVKIVHNLYEDGKIIDTYVVD